MAFRKEKGYVTPLFHHHTLPQHIKRTIALSQYNTAQQQNSQRSTLNSNHDVSVPVLV